MTTDAQAALAQVRDALANRPSAGPWVATLRDPGTFQVATVDNFGVYSRHPDHGGNAVGFPEHDAAYIAACSPANMAAILAHVETQAAEIERLTAALQHEADCVEAAKAEIERLTAALHAQPGPVSMDDVEWAGKAHLHDAQQEIERLRAAAQHEADCAEAAKAEVEALRAERDALKAEIDRLREWQRQMVEKAASGGRLDGYRELAGKLAAKDAENDRLRAALVAAMAIVQEDRAAFALANIWPDGRMDNDDGDVLRRYDAVIAQAREAMGSEG